MVTPPEVAPGVVTFVIGAVTDPDGNVVVVGNVALRLVVGVVALAFIVLRLSASVAGAGA